ncbi:hypothetical protein RHMOL_Rhmol13G0287800 [Rhododendron molle]|uniref:Uncharacterized protein n=1 Tax=Rhododendron molle TaxID=49168 RepID=A0ACC0LBR9_RHOML|nr:hypothetical protein RHMOL_Rhmol13G0287800 [Rhododendron molle]
MAESKALPTLTYLTLLNLLNLLLLLIYISSSSFSAFDRNPYVFDPPFAIIIINTQLDTPERAYDYRDSCGIKSFSICTRSFVLSISWIKGISVSL